MQSTPRERLLQFSHLLQTGLFERLGQEVGPLGERAPAGFGAGDDCIESISKLSR